MAMEFESILFKSEVLDEGTTNALKNDLELINKLERDKLPKAFSGMKEILISKSSTDRKGLQEKFLKEGVFPDKTTLLAFNRFASSFLKVFTREEVSDDSPKNLVTDLVTLTILKAPNQLIIELLELIKENAVWYEKEELKDAFRSGLSPSFKGVTTTVELRGVFDKEIGLGESLDEYSSSVQMEKSCPVVPVITISIRLDSGTPDKFVFQTSPKELEWLIEGLQAGLHKSKLLTTTYEKLK